MRVAEMTGGAFFFGDHNRVAAAGVHGQNIGRAKLDTNRTALAPGRMNLDLASRSLARGLFLNLHYNRFNFGHNNPFCVGISCFVLHFYKIPVLVLEQSFFGTINHINMII